MPGGILGGDDRIEPAFQANVSDLFLDDVAEAAAGHRHRKFSLIFPHDRGDRLDFNEQMHAVQERLFLLMSDSDRVERQIHLV